MWAIGNDVADKKGFSLVELLIAIGLMSVISAGIVSLIGQGPRQTARDGRRQADLEKIASALELYRNDNASYPPCFVNATVGCVVTTADLPGLSAPTSYLSTYPADADATRQYVYNPLDPSGGTCDGTGADRCVTYSLCTALEKVTAAVGGTPACGGDGCGGTCSFRITNP